MDRNDRIQVDHSVVPAEYPLRVFVSSVMSELKQEREELTKILTSYPLLSAWTFEFTPGSSEPVEDTYLRYVRESDLVIWLVGRETTKPVVKEVQEALASNRPLWVVKLPVDERSEETKALLAKVGSRVKWIEVGSGGLAQAIIPTLQDELARLWRRRPDLGYTSRLHELKNRSLARCIARWQATGVPVDKAEEFATNISVGDPHPVIKQHYARSRLLVLIGDVGAGKSLIAERLYQQAIDVALKDINSPIPVFLEAHEAINGLEDAIKRAADGLGNPHVQGVCAFVDGLDEIGTAASLRILTEARVLARTWPNTRIVITSRPLVSLDNIEEAINVPLLSEDQAYALISDLADVANVRSLAFNWPQPIREALRFPLFAVLLGNYLRTQDMKVPRSKGELISNLVQQALERHGREFQHVTRLLCRLAALSIDRNGSPVPMAEVASPEEIPPLRNSGLVIEDSGAISFALPILTQWFASRSLASGFPSVSELLSDPERLEAWRMPLAIFVATYDHERVTNILRPIAVEHPGFASQIVSDGLANWGLEDGISPPPPHECGMRIRTAMQAWIEGIGPLAKLIAPIGDEGNLLPLGVRSAEGGLWTGWYRGKQRVSDILTLPSNDKQLRDWPEVTWARPGRQSAWAWRWTLGELSDNLARLLRQQALPTEEGPLFMEYIWAAANTLVRPGSVDQRPIPLSEIEWKLSRLPEGQEHIRYNGKLWALRPVKKEILRLLSMGETVLRSPWPAPDQEIRSGWMWEMYSHEQLIARTEAVYKGALEGYCQLVGTWFAKLAEWLQTWAMLPARLKGTLLLPDPRKGLDGAPVISWYFEPLPSGDTSYVELTVTTNPRSIQDLPFNELESKIRQLRHLRAARIGITVRHQVLDIFDHMPATKLAYAWLRGDLRRISWVTT